MRNEYLTRNYEEIEHTIKNGGYVLWDCLTYSNKHVPWAKKILYKEFGVSINNKYNFRCFNYKDVRDWLKRFRESYTKKFGFRPNMKYFIAGEYGEKNDYIDDRGNKRYGTHRPHYHVLLHILDKTKPEEVSEIIWKTWQKGKCDGIKDNNTQIFWSEKVISTLDPNKINRASYISKYVCKDSTYTKYLNDLLSNIDYEYIQPETLHDHFHYEKHTLKGEHIIIDHDINQKVKFNDKNFKQTICSRKKFQSFKRALTIFHKQSSGLGLSLIDKIGDKELDENKIMMPRYNIYKCKITIPNIVKRHLFYEKVLRTDKRTGLKRLIFHKDWYGRLVPNDLYKEKYGKMIDLKLKKTFESYQKILLNSIELQQKICELLNKNILNNYDIRKLAKYSVCYKGRLKRDKFYHLDMFKALSLGKIKEYPNLLGKENFENGKYKTSHGEILHWFLKDNVINQDTYKRFRNFDYCLMYIYKEAHRQGLGQEALYWQNIEMRRKFKN